MLEFNLVKNELLRYCVYNSFQNLENVGYHEIEWVSVSNINIRINSYGDFFGKGKCEVDLIFHLGGRKDGVQHDFVITPNFTFKLEAGKSIKDLLVEIDENSIDTDAFYE